MTTYISIMTDVLAEEIGLSRDVIEKALREEMAASDIEGVDEEVPEHLVQDYKQRMLDNPDAMINPVRRGFEQAKDKFVKQAREKDKRIQLKHARSRKKR